DFPLEPGDVVVEQTAVLDDPPGDLALPGGERRQRQLVAAPDLLDDREIGRREHPQVLTILPVDALDILGDHELDARTPLGVWGLLTRRPFPAPLARHRRHVPAALHGPFRDW